MKTTAYKRKFNRVTYKSYLLRVRRKSDLNALLEAHAAQGETSVNFLVTELLCSHFGCKLPHREYLRTKRERII
jgi:predicted HicB family RNase H-like nuclease